MQNSWYDHFTNLDYHTIKVKLVTVVEGDQKAPFSIATTPKCKGGHYSFSLDCSSLHSVRTWYCWALSKQVSSTNFKVFGMTRPGIEPRSPVPLANTLPTKVELCLKNYNVSNPVFFVQSAGPAKYTDCTSADG